MRRMLGMACAVVLGMSPRGLAAQSTCRGDHCVASVTTTLVATVPAIARVSVVASGGAAAVVIGGNARLVLQMQRDSASSAPVTLGQAGVPTRIDLTGESSGTVRYTATAP